LVLDSNIPVPQITHSDELLIRVRASTVTTDELKWRETYLDFAIPGHDFAGTIVAVSSEYDIPDTDGKGGFNLGDEVYGMTLAAGKGSTWAEYAVVRSDEVSLKPKRLDWAQSATVPMSALTAWQALFEKAGISPPDLKDTSRSKVSQEGQSKGKILINGASGAVGTFLVQLAALGGLHVVAASTSNERNIEFLLSLGAIEVFEY
ncbi:chaperonin 10-like protein, partial [Lipomyces starkeyi]